MVLFHQLILIVPMLFLAGIIDGVSGGGGLIALPAYLMAGLPVHLAYGCNKLQSLFGTTASLSQYVKNNFVDFKIVSISAIFAFIGSIISTKLVSSMDESLVQKLIFALLPLIIVLMFIKKFVKSKNILRMDISPKNILSCIIIGFILGMYDGFYGPGGGTVSIILYSLFCNYDVRVGNGNGKFIIIISNIAALFHYIVAGDIIYAIAIPAAIANIFGSYIGANFAIKKGEKLILPFMSIIIIVVSVQLFINFI